MNLIRESETEPSPLDFGQRSPTALRHERLKRVYLVLRLLAYALGVSGGALAFCGQNAAPAVQRKMFAIGGGLMIVMFLVFLASHGLYLYMKFGRSSRS